MTKQVDVNRDYMYEMWGTTHLITEVGSEKLFKVKNSQEKTDFYEIPEDRYSRHCGGKGGFDDFVERWHE